MLLRRRPAGAKHRPLLDTIIGGDGSSSGVSGSFSGTVHSAGLSNSLKLSGFITIP
jgi:hypothetical protein